MKNLYKINNSIEKLEKGKNTLFLDNSELNIIKGKIKKNTYNIYYSYEDADKVILYKNEIPNIKLLKIECFYNLRHQDILGSLFNLGIDISYIGDIIKYEDNFYIYVLDEMSDYLIKNLVMISNYKVDLKVVDLFDYKREYEYINIIVSSLRMDNVISSLINVSRNETIEKIKNKEIILNYEQLNKNSYILKENDVFSIKKYGKYKYIGVEKMTKKNKYIINVLKYK